MACTKQSGTCGRCRGDCEHKPGWFLPGEAEKAAAHLGLTMQQFFDRYLAVDWWEGTAPTFLLSPAVQGEETGEEFPGDPRGTCVFYQGGRCQIHKVKPHECREVWCGAEAGSVHEDTARAWQGHQQQIRDLLGREPIAESYEGGSIFDLFGGGW
jgi:Fe-S-cluster containining protein